MIIVDSVKDSYHDLYLEVPESIIGVKKRRPRVSQLSGFLKKVVCFMLYNVSYCRVLILRICQFPHRSINKGLLLEWVCGILAFGHLRIGSWSTRKPSVSKQGIKAAFRSKRREKKFFTFYVWHPDCWKVWEKFDKYVQQIFVCLTRHKLFCLVCGRRIFNTSWIAEISGVGEKNELSKYDTNKECKFERRSATMVEFDLASLGDSSGSKRMLL